MEKHQSELAGIIEKYSTADTRLLQVGGDKYDIGLKLETKLPHIRELVLTGASQLDDVDIVLDESRLAEYFPLSYFNFVVVLKPLEMIMDWRRALLQVSRVLSNNGYVIITTNRSGYNKTIEDDGVFWYFADELIDDILAPIGNVVETVSSNSVKYLIMRRVQELNYEVYEKFLRTLFPLQILVGAEQQLKLSNTVLFDQASRLNFASEIISAVGLDGDHVLDVGCGQECLLGRYLSKKMNITYIDPLLQGISNRNVHQLAGSVSSDLLNGLEFDHVIGIDILEHIKIDQRKDFISKISSLAKKSVVLLFPTSDMTDSLSVDHEVNESYKKVFNQDYPWLDEHHSYGLPSASETAAILKEMGWDVSIYFHGNSRVLSYTLPIVLLCNEDESTRDLAKRISNSINDDIYELDQCPPFYRVCLLATRSDSAIPSIEQKDCSFFLHKWNILREKILFDIQVVQHEMQVGNIQAYVHLLWNLLDSERKVSADERKQIQDECARRLSSKHDELMDISEWADGINRKMKSFERIPFVKYLLKYSLVLEKGYRYVYRRAAVRFLPNWLYENVCKCKSKVNFLSLRRSITKNDGNVIIIFPIIPWTYRWQRPQHLSCEFSKKGFTVIYLPVTPMARFSLFKDILEAKSQIFFRGLHDDVFTMDLYSFSEFDIYKDSLDEDNIHNLKTSLLSALSCLKIAEPFFLVQFPSWYPVVKELRDSSNGKIVFDCLDDHSGFENTTEDALMEEKELLSTSDLVIASSDILFDNARQYRDDVVLAQNAAEFPHFSSPSPNGELDYLTDKPIVGYYGAVAEWFDSDLVAYCAMSRPDWNFIIIGSVQGADVSIFSGLSNIFLLGEKPYKDLPGYLYYFDVCTIPFKTCSLTEATNPVKFYEYLCTGKPVVSVNLPELDSYRDICYLSASKKDFLGNLDLALEEGDNLDVRSKRVNIAVSNSWESRVEKILESKIFTKRH